MKKIPLLIAVVALFVSVFSFFYFRSSDELVYVDVNRLMNGYKRTKVEKNKFKAKSEKLNAKIDTIMADWRKEVKAYEKERSEMTDKELKLKQEMLSNKQQGLNTYQKKIQKKIKKANQQSTQTVLNDINDYIKRYGENHGYKIIFGARGGGNIMYADDASDLTKEVLKGLNDEYAGK